MTDIRETVVSSIGPKAVHALEDGLTVGLLTGLALTFPVGAIVLLVSLGCVPARAGPIAILREVTDLVREDDARAQESYFMLSALVGLVSGVLSGTWLTGYVGHIPIADVLTAVT